MKTLFALSFIAFLPAFLLAEICTKQICEYKLVIRQARTMVYRGPGKLYEVKLNGTKLQVVETANNQLPDDVIGTYVNDSDVITGDGYRRTVFTINGQFPGPTIEVMEGSQVSIRVENHLLREVITIHWHGLGMRGTPWMDGVPLLTQCPIEPRKSFNYRFMADPPGTHWYHSHEPGQLIDGLYGMFIVHPKGTPIPPTSPEFPLMLGDWNRIEGDTVEVISPSSRILPNRGTGEDLFVHPKYRDYSHDGVNNAALKWESGLINGRGRHDGKKYPLSKFNVQRGTEYRFRMINVGGEFSLVVSIDNHLLRLLASDGFELEPVEVKYIIINPGERIDFSVVANQIEGRYWIRAATPHDYSVYETFDGKIHEVKAVLVYEHISDDRDPTSRPYPCTPHIKCRVFNCPYGSFPASYNMTCINMDQVQSKMSARQITELYGVGDDDIHEVFMNIGYQGGSAINGRVSMMPDAPVFQNDSHMIKCSEVCTKDAPCRCTYIIKLPFNKTVQIVISNFQPVSYVGHHPVHIHGNSFAVMHIGYATHDSNTGRWMDRNKDVKCDDDGTVCSEPSWTSSRPDFTPTKPAIKDTIIVPARGYTVLRMRTTNPGFWLVHCHMNHHLENGMAAIIQSGDEPPPPPSNFPTCSDFTYTAQQFAEQTIIADQYLRYGRAQTTPTTTTTTPGPKTTTTQTIFGGAKEGHVYMKTRDLIWTIIGSVLVGFIITLIPVLICTCCRSTNDSPKVHPDDTRF